MCVGVWGEEEAKGREKGGEGERRGRKEGREEKTYITLDIMASYRQGPTLPLRGHFH